MSLKPSKVSEVPEGTDRVARRLGIADNTYFLMRELLGNLYEDADFEDLFPARGQPALAPWRLALVCVMQFAEGLSDREAASAVRYRIDWKCALGLELDDPGFDASVLVEFRQRLIEHGAEHRLLDKLLDVMKQKELLKSRGRQRTDSTHVLARIRTLSRLESIGETLYRALNELAAEDPEWFKQNIPPAWRERYSCHYNEYRLPPERSDRETLAGEMGADGFRLLEMVYASDARKHLAELPGVEILRKVWIQQFYAPFEAFSETSSERAQLPVDNSGSSGPQHGGKQHEVRWRKEEDLPPSSVRIWSPYDPEARFSRKRRTEWIGYKVHMTETCDEDAPHLIVDVDTTPSTTVDGEVLNPIHDRLALKGLLPSEHMVDAGYTSVEHVHRAKTQYQIDLLGPMPPGISWQSKTPDALDASQFEVNWQEHSVRCPEGRRSTQWTQEKDARGHPVVHARFDLKDCQGCRMRSQCTRSAKKGRTLTLRPEPHYHLLKELRSRQTTEEFKERYARRAGIEGTLSQLMRECTDRRCRYIGLTKTHLQQIACAAAINIRRSTAWLSGCHRETVRSSAITRLADVSSTMPCRSSTLFPS